MSVTSSAQPRSGRALLVRKLSTYAASSAVATVCSEVTLVVCFGVLHLPTGVATVVAWIAGAVPNFLINRSLTWQRSGRPSLRRELAPYAGIVLITLVFAVIATHVVALAASGESQQTRTTLVAITYLGVYVLMFVVRYFLLDRLFSRLTHTDSVTAGQTR